MNPRTLLTIACLIGLVISSLLEKGMSDFRMPSPAVWAFFFFFASLPAAYGAKADRGRFVAGSDSLSPTFTGAAISTGSGLLMVGLPVYLLYLLVGISQAPTAQSASSAMVGFAFILFFTATLLAACITALIVSLTAGLGAHLSSKFNPRLAPLGAATFALLGGLLIAGFSR